MSQGDCKNGLHRKSICLAHDTTEPLSPVSSRDAAYGSGGEHADIVLGLRQHPDTEVFSDPRKIPGGETPPSVDLHRVFNKSATKCVMNPMCRHIRQTAHLAD